MSDLTVIQKLARNLMDQYGLNDWTLKFGRARNQSGLCDRRHKRITLSAPLMAIWPQDECLMTILHEIAHALTTGHHTPEWRRTFISMGGDGKVCWNASDGRPLLPAKYTGTCPGGHQGHRRDRVPRGPMSCQWCSSRYDPRYLITWTRNA